MNQLLDPYQIFSHELIGAYLAIVLTLAALVIVRYYEDQDKKRMRAIGECLSYQITKLPYEAVIEDHQVDWDWPDRKQFPYDHERKRPDWLRSTSQ